MTLVELQAERDRIVKSIGYTRKTFGDRSVEYSNASAALVLIDAEIAKVNAVATGNTWRGTLATFSND